MLNGDILRGLLESWAQGDDSSFRETAEKIIQSEREKNHRLLADDLERILRSRASAKAKLTSRKPDLILPKDQEKGLPLLDISYPDEDWERLVLAPKKIEVLRPITNEHTFADRLAEAGLKPRRRLLFYGPPGCGKTLAARVLAGVLGIPLITVRFDSLISSYLGETAANLRKIFDFIRNGHFVVLFDEFDAVGKDRSSEFEHGELKRVVNTLLQLMDSYDGVSLLIAATNHETLLDHAIWRRFETILEFAPPTEQERILLLRLFLRGFKTTDSDLKNIAKNSKGLSGADLELIALQAARQAVLDNRSEIAKADLDLARDMIRRSTPMKTGKAE